jgi:hypothetical protein
VDKPAEADPSSLVLVDLVEVVVDKLDAEDTHQQEVDYSLDQEELDYN